MAVNQATAKSKGKAKTSPAEEDQPLAAQSVLFDLRDYRISGDHSRVRDPDEKIYTKRRKRRGDVLGQSRLDFEAAGVISCIPESTDITVPVVNSVAELKALYRLGPLREDHFQSHDRQLEFLCRYFELDQGMLLDSPTGSGKSYMVIVAALWELMRSSDAKVLLLTPMTHLVQQIYDDARYLLDLDPRLLCRITGKLTDIAKRREIYRSGRARFLFATPETIRNDLENNLFCFAGFKLLVLDEVHHHAGDYAYVPVVREARRAGLKILAGSACPVPSAGNSVLEKLERKDLMEQLGIKHFHKIEWKQRDKWEYTHQVELEGNAALAAQMLKELAKSYALGLYEALQRFPELQKKFQQMTKVNSDQYRFPTHKEVESFSELLKRTDLHFLDSSIWWSLQEIHHMHNGLTSYGQYYFLTYAGEQLWDLHYADPVAPGTRQHYSDFDKKHPKGYQRHAYYKRRILNDPAFRAVFKLLSSGDDTLYTMLLMHGEKGKGWGQERVHRQELLECVFGVREAEEILNRNSGGGRQEFFARATELMVERDYVDHPKEKRLLELTQKDIWRWPGVAAFCFCDRVLQTKFLSARFNFRQSQQGFLSAAFFGAGNPGITSKEQERIKQSVKDGEIKLVFVTSAAEEGIHLPEANLMYVWSHTAEAKRVMQRLGRIDRKKKYAEFDFSKLSRKNSFVSQIHHLITKGEQDERLFWAARKAHRARGHVKRGKKNGLV